MYYLAACLSFILKNIVLILPQIHSHTHSFVSIKLVFGGEKVMKCLYSIKCLCHKGITIIDIKFISLMFQTNYFIAFLFLFALPMSQPIVSTDIYIFF